jgi:hypothetical protein
VNRADDTVLLEWLPRRGRWLGPAITGSAFAIGVLIGSFMPRATTTPAIAPEPIFHPSCPLVEAPKPEVAKPVEVQAPVIVEPVTFSVAAKRERSQARALSRENPVVLERAPEVLVDVRIDSEPQGAIVLSPDGQLGRTPLTVFLPGNRTTTLRLRLEGHKEARLRWTGSDGSTVVTKLEKNS